MNYSITRQSISTGYWITWRVWRTHIYTRHWWNHGRQSLIRHSVYDFRVYNILQTYLRNVWLRISHNSDELSANVNCTEGDRSRRDTNKYFKYENKTVTTSSITTVCNILYKWLPSYCIMIFMYLWLFFFLSSSQNSAWGVLGKLSKN